MHAPPAKPASQPPAPTRSAAPQTPVSLAKRPPSSPPLAKKPAFRDLLTRAQERIQALERALKERDAAQPGFSHGR